MSNRKPQSLRMAHRITERRDGAVYRTEPLGEVWVDMGLHRDPDDPDVIYSSLSTDRLRELIEAGEPTNRMVEV